MGNGKSTWSFGGVPNAAPKTHKKKPVLLDKGLANLKELRRLNLRRKNQFTIVPVSHCSHTVESSHSVKIGQPLESDEVEKSQKQSRMRGNGQNGYRK